MNATEPLQVTTAHFFVYYNTAQLYQPVLTERVPKIILCQEAQVMPNTSMFHTVNHTNDDNKISIRTRMHITHKNGLYIS